MLQLLGQQHRMQGHRHRGGQDTKHLPVGHLKGRLARPYPNQQRTNVLTFMLKETDSLATLRLPNDAISAPLSKCRLAHGSRSVSHTT
jgi:hypothetical protein